MSADLTSLLSKFLVSLWNGSVYSAVLGGSTIGIPAKVASGRAVAQTAAVAALCTITPSVDSTYLILGNVNVTASTTHSFNLGTDFSDEVPNARTALMGFVNNGGSMVGNPAIVNGGGVNVYYGMPMLIRAKAGTAVTCKTVGTFTTVTYNVEAHIIQIA